jgi:hypothetical protein
VLAPLFCSQKKRRKQINKMAGWLVAGWLLARRARRPAVISCTIFVKNPLLAGTMAGWLGIKFLFIF